VSEHSPCRTPKLTAPRLALSIAATALAAFAFAPSALAAPGPTGRISVDSAGNQRDDTRWDGVAKPRADRCGSGRPIVNVVARVRNVVDFGADGHVWALDDYAKHIKIWRIGDSVYCVLTRDEGRFSTFAGASPEGTGTVSEGVRGTLGITLRFDITGTFAPTAPTRGFIGTFDVACSRDGTCTGPEPRETDLYFSSVDDFAFVDFRAVYRGGRHGTWIQTPQGDQGDITG
jgi:hypothetical protein